MYAPERDRNTPKDPCRRQDSFEPSTPARKSRNMPRKNTIRTRNFCVDDLDSRISRVPLFRPLADNIFKSAFHGTNLEHGISLIDESGHVIIHCAELDLCRVEASMIIQHGGTCMEISLTLHMVHQGVRFRYSDGYSLVRPLIKRESFRYISTRRYVTCNRGPIALSAYVFSAFYYFLFLPL